MAMAFLKILAFHLLLLISGVIAADDSGTKTFNFTIDWVKAAPDGFERRVIGINGQWPIPVMNVNKGDRVIVHVKNNIDQQTSLHWHGLYQNGTTHMDGPVGASQCAINPGKSITYDFEVKQEGTYWYHSHVQGQYPDGLRGPLIVHDRDNPYAGAFDEEVVMSLSDWYHDQMPDLLASFISVTNPTGAEPVPNAALMNDTQNFKFNMVPGKTYFFRIVNMAAFAGQYLWFEGHTMDIIEVDGIYTERQPAHMIYVTAAQRYGVLITARKDTKQNWAIVGSMDESLFDTVPPTLNPNVTGHLVYDTQKPLPKAMEVSKFEPFDDWTLVPYDREELFGTPSKIVDLTLKMGDLINGANYAFFNDVTYVTPKVPTLYSALSTGANATNPAIYGTNTNAFVLNEGDIVELRMNNNDGGKHPFHLHGHAFQTAYRSPPNAGFYNAAKTPPSTFRQKPMRRDTFMVNPNGNFVLRFRADNPGIWLYHCHIEWHIATGLVATMIEAPIAVQKQLQGKIPESFFQLCRDNDIPTTGNAAGNTQDLLNLQGENTAPGRLPAGFTAKGYVALVFSCISAFLGMVVIGWYGAKPIKGGGL